MSLIEKQEKYQHYHQVKLINMNIFQVKKYCYLIKVKQQKKLGLPIVHSPFERQKQLKNKEKKVEALKV